MNVIELIPDTSILFALGFCGFTLFRLMHIPVAPLLGSLTVIGLLRLGQYPISLSPFFVSLMVQVLLGLYIGQK